MKIESAKQRQINIAEGLAINQAQAFVDQTHPEPWQVCKTSHFPYNKNMTYNE